MVQVIKYPFNEPSGNSYNLHCLDNWKRITTERTVLVNLISFHSVILQWINFLMTFVLIHKYIVIDNGTAD